MDPNPPAPSYGPVNRTCLWDCAYAPLNATALNDTIPCIDDPALSNLT